MTAVETAERHIKANPAPAGADARFCEASDVLVFLRVPKTGSTSLATVLANGLGVERSVHLSDRHVDGLHFGARRVHDQLRRGMKRARDDIKGYARQALGRGDAVADALFLHGHHPLWGSLRTRRRRHYVMVLRDPVDRFLSLYYYYRSKAAKARDGVGQEKRRIAEMDPNAYARWLVDKGIASRLNGHCLYLSPSGDLDEARRALDARVAFAAMVDELPVLVERLSGFVQRPLTALPREKLGTNRPKESPLEPATVKMLRDVLADDYRLIDHLAKRRAGQSAVVPS